MIRKLGGNRRAFIMPGAALLYEENGEGGLLRITISGLDSILNNKFTYHSWTHANGDITLFGRMFQYKLRWPRKTWEKLFRELTDGRA